MTPPGRRGARWSDCGDRGAGPGRLVRDAAIAAVGGDPGLPRLRPDELRADHGPVGRSPCPSSTVTGRRMRAQPDRRPGAPDRSNQCAAPVPLVLVDRSTIKSRPTKSLNGAQSRTGVKSGLSTSIVVIRPQCVTDLAGVAPVQCGNDRAIGQQAACRAGRRGPLSSSAPRRSGPCRITAADRSPSQSNWICVAMTTRAAGPARRFQRPAG